MTLPQDFLDFIRSYPQLRVLEQSLCTPAETSVRYNTAKASVPDDAETVSWCETGVYPAERPKFTLDPAIHQGCYYVQDASSMAICAVLKQLADKPVRYLDACAAPGGKTTAAMSVLPDGSFTVANEFDYRRADILAENIAKWGDPAVMLTRGDTSRLAKLRDAFDIISVDAPCSGEGMMRKEETAVSQWSQGLTRQCASLQREILQNAWKALRPGGFLVYSTCTFNLDENERNVQFLVDEFGAEPVLIPALDTIAGICGALEGNNPCYRFIPGNIRGEGLFIAAVRKPSGEHQGSLRQKQNKSDNSKPSPLLKEAAKWINEGFKLINRGDEIYAIPEEHAAFIDQVSAVADAFRPGVHVGTIKGRDLVPAHQLALSLALNKQAFPMAEIGLDNALDFLRREAITLPAECPKGIVLLTYNNIPLGFVKNLGNRTNNLLPKQWRILSRN